MNKTINLSVALATYNEELNIGACLDSVKDIADEIIIVDGTSTDKTVEIAKQFGAKVTITDNPPIFHINKQKAIDQCHSKWILQLDADERVSQPLAREIMQVITMTEKQIEEYQHNLPNKELFLRHQELLVERDGQIGLLGGEYAAFFLPRLNYFLGKYLKYGGVYPDGVIRLIKNGLAYLPVKDVHEQMVVNGRVGWLANDLIHMADPTFSRYLQRNSRYIDLLSAELSRNKTKLSVITSINYLLIKPIWWLLLTLIRHRGIWDGYRGIVFSFFSALRFPRAYWRYLFNK
ncbi:MAG: glycosyltransferase family 2 protein [Bacteroidota bacterium]|nr:glycosyltransferase family 2 protein [Bacteroidota bacterium]